jgi:hypothetical protein
MTLTTPPIASDPYSALCGPFSTSMRSIALGANIAKSKSPLAAVGSLMRMPSIITRVWPVLAPRSRIFVVEPGPPDSVMSSPGTVRKASTSEPGLLVASVSLLTTLTALPVRLIGSGVRSGVTTSSEDCGGWPELFDAGSALLALVPLWICRAGLDGGSGLTSTGGSCSDFVCSRATQ